MRVAQVAPLVLPVPPAEYGGTERVIYNLCEALVSRGHEVTLFASGDSDTSARLAPAVPKALSNGAPIPDPIAPVLRMHAEVFRRAHEFDVIHTHTDYFAFAFARESRAPVLSTLHGRLDIPITPKCCSSFPRSISWRSAAHSSRRRRARTGPVRCTMGSRSTITISTRR